MGDRVITLTSAFSAIEEQGSHEVVIASEAVSEAVVDRLQACLQTLVSDRLDVLDATLTKRLESMSHEIMSKQEEIFQRFAQAVTKSPCPHQDVRPRSMPEQSCSFKGLCRKEMHRRIIQRARCNTQSQTVQRFRKFHTEELLRVEACSQVSVPNPDKSPSDRSIASCPGALCPSSSSASPGMDPPLLECTEEVSTDAALQDVDRSDMEPTVRDKTREMQREGKSCYHGDAVQHKADLESHNGLPGAVLDELNFDGILPKSYSMKTMDGLRTRTEASLVARKKSKSPNGTTQIKESRIGRKIGGKKTIESIRRVWAICGIVPWSACCLGRWYQRVIIGVSAGAALLSLTDFVYHPDQLFESIAHSSLYFCVFLNLIFLRHMGSLVGPLEHPFTDYAFGHGFLIEWGVGGLLRMAFTTSLWVVATSLTCGIPFVTAAEYVRVPIVSWRNGLLLAIIHCLWQVLAFLELMVDSYCNDFCERMNCHQGVLKWNALQALLRRVAEAVESCFLTVQTGVIVALLSCAGRLVTLKVNMTNQSAALNDLVLLVLTYIPVLLIAFATVVLFAKAASVTEKCSRVPSLINSLTLEEDKQIDYERQYLVAYVWHSDAGFYVKGTRFTAAMLIKFCCLFGTLSCGLVTTIASIAQKA